MELCGECSGGNHDGCLAFSTHPGVTELEKWCECPDELGVAYYGTVSVGNVVEMPVQPRRRGPKPGNDPLGIQERAWKGLALSVGGPLPSELIREVHRRYDLMRLQAHRKAKPQPEVTVAIQSVQRDVLNGLL